MNGTLECPAVLGPVEDDFSLETTSSPRAPAAMAEADLVDLVKAGDQTACETLVRTFGGRMLSAVRRVLRNEDDAQDALQDAFLSVFRSIHRFEGESQLGTWLYRIAVNAALMKLRARKRRQDLSMDELLQAAGGPGQRPGAGPAWQEPGDKLLERQELRALVRRKIDLLPHDHRTVLVLRDIDELSTEETAAVLGINPGAVKTRLHRARAALGALLELEGAKC